MNTARSPCNIAENALFQRSSAMLDGLFCYFKELLCYITHMLYAKKISEIEHVSPFDIAEEL